MSFSNKQDGNEEAGELNAMDMMCVFMWTGKKYNVLLALFAHGQCKELWNPRTRDTANSSKF